MRPLDKLYTTKLEMTKSWKTLISAVGIKGGKWGELPSPPSGGPVFKQEMMNNSVCTCAWHHIAPKEKIERNIDQPISWSSILKNGTWAILARFIRGHSWMFRKEREGGSASTSGKGRSSWQLKSFNFCWGVINPYQWI